MPGRPLKPNTDYSKDFENVPKSNLAMIKSAESFVYEWLAKETKGTKPEEVPDEWKCSYDMRGWKDFPDRSPRLD